jgi:hypothetical protein
MKYFFSILFIFSLTFINSFSTQEESSKKTLDFATFLFNENYISRTLEDIEDSKKFKFNYETKDYFLYSEKSLPNQEFEIKTTFYVGWDYAIIGAGNSTLKDIDLYIYDSEGLVVAIDRNSSGISFPMIRSNYMDIYSNANNDMSIEGKRISIRPLKSGNYTIKIKVRNGFNSEGFWSVMILTRKSQ